MRWRAGAPSAPLVRAAGLRRRGDVLEVSLNGSVVPAGTARFSYDLGALAPNTVYTLDFSVGFDQVHVEQTFTTGNGPAEPQPGAAPGAVTTSRRADSDFAPPDFCYRVLWAQDCYETRRARHAFLVRAERLRRGVAGSA